MKVKDFKPGEAFKWNGGVYVVVDFKHSHLKLVPDDFDEDDGVVVVVLQQGGSTKPWRITRFSRDEEMEPYENP